MSQQIYNIVCTVYTEYTVFPTKIQIYRTVTLAHLLPIHIGEEIEKCLGTHLDIFTIWGKNEALWEHVTPESNWES